MVTVFNLVSVGDVVELDVVEPDGTHSHTHFRAREGDPWLADAFAYALASEHARVLQALEAHSGVSRALPFSGTLAECAAQLAGGAR